MDEQIAKNHEAKQEQSSDESETRYVALPKPGRSSKVFTKASLPIQTPSRRSVSPNQIPTIREASPNPTPSMRAGSPNPTPSMMEASRKPRPAVSPRGLKSTDPDRKHFISSLQTSKHENSDHQPQTFSDSQNEYQELTYVFPSASEDNGPDPAATTLSTSLSQRSSSGSDNSVKVDNYMTADLDALPSDDVYENYQPKRVTGDYANYQQSSPLCYWGDITREEADQRLLGAPDGSFLVRDSRTPGEYALTVKQDGQNRTMKIYQRNGRFGLKPSDTELKFNSLNDLIHHYTNHTLAEFNKRLLTFLLYPVCKPELMTTALVKEALYKQLFILADRGRQLFEARKEYVRLQEKQLKANQALHCAMVKVKANETAMNMYKDCFGLAWIDEDEKKNPELVKNQSWSLHKHLDFKDRVAQANKDVKQREEELHTIINDINIHGSVLGDQEDDCARIKEQLLGGGAKNEFVELLLDDRYLRNSTKTSSWLVQDSRKEAEAKLKDMDVGTFLVRPREVLHQPYALSVVYSKGHGEKGVNHILIHYKNERYGFKEDSTVYLTLEELIARHAYINLNIYFSHMDTYLVRPVFASSRNSGETIVDDLNPLIRDMSLRC